jgi:uncharacterized lipoprotein
MIASRTLILLCASALVLSGCGRLFKTTCAKPEDFAAAEERPPLKMPAGRDAPDTRQALPIPPLNEPEKPRSEADPCLDTPPRYAIPRPTAPAA